MSRLPLEGIRILDLTAVLSGTYMVALLADMGAEVIKIEALQRYDYYRLTSPTEPGNLEKSAHYNWCNHSKLGITLDLTRPRGVEIFKQLVRISDIVAENFSARVMTNFGLDYPVLSKINPSVIMLSMPCFGATGPWRDYVGFAHIFEEMSGAVYLTGYIDGPPMVSATSYPDQVAGVNGTFALLSALHQRRRTGRGQFIDLSQTETLTCLLGAVVADYAMNQRNQSRLGNRHPFLAPHSCYRCQGDDKWLTIAVASEAQWQILLQIMGNPEWAREERFATMMGRWDHQDELNKLIEEWTSQRDQYELWHLLQKAGIAAGPMLLAQDLIDDPHLNQRGFHTMVTRAVVGTHPHSCVATKFSKTPTPIKGPAPLLGEHNEWAFSELLGMSKEEMAKLEQEKFIGKVPVWVVPPAAV